MTNLDDKGLPFTVRTVFIIDDKKTVRLSLQYPASTGRQFNEILRCIDSLQLTDKEKVATPQVRFLPAMLGIRAVSHSEELVPLVCLG